MTDDSQKPPSHLSSEPLQSTPIRPESGASFSLVRNYFQTLWSIITHPVDFFRMMPTQGGLTSPLAFAVVTYWISEAFQFLWGAIFRTGWDSLYQRIAQLSQYSDTIDYSGGRLALEMSQKQEFLSWVMNLGSVIISPFFTVVTILITGLLLFIAAKLLAEDRTSGFRQNPVSYESATRIFCYAGAASIFGFIPFVGAFAGHLYTTILIILGAREVYRIGTGRAILLGLFPKLIGFILVLFLGFLLIILMTPFILLFA